MRVVAIQILLQGWGVSLKKGGAWKKENGIYWANTRKEIGKGRAKKIGSG